ncbi:hypothetical protein TREMEDRAFT_55970 [Tremella mesenterica DSM 1558]|uniref:uncharacterized protein n=1 Tax=Tremella mesenterica (strain ATCC 24925 / CBS 8224 / DSM 1558 / NBRC 9311 / NRRL Y-6157 / RJB 2259-6 / UBC 559-6) TaxID=578456 RepID=UPI0003F4A3E4|nr:uncharacterized protein TREMEDRAFT_55970 [Tremella mesenterica DSM 1558]EIW72564.1 hypothetical protein TREMEDRAFT_55970 [Tremella mesenterica DSM 1558]
MCKETKALTTLMEGRYARGSREMEWWQKAKEAYTSVNQKNEAKIYSRGRRL